MTDAATVVGALVLVAVLAFLVPVISIACGGFAGWVAGMFFPTTLTQIAHLLGLSAPYQLGAAAAFVGSFFHSSSTSKKD